MDDDSESEELSRGMAEQVEDSRRTAAARSARWSGRISARNSSRNSTASIAWLRADQRDSLASLDLAVAIDVQRHGGGRERRRRSWRQRQPFQWCRQQQV